MDEEDVPREKWLQLLKLFFVNVQLSASLHLVYTIIVYLQYYD